MLNAKKLSLPALRQACVAPRWRTDRALTLPAVPSVHRAAFTACVRVTYDYHCVRRGT
jgi:hypothetical protein